MPEQITTPKPEMGKRSPLLTEVCAAFVKDTGIQEEHPIKNGDVVFDVFTGQQGRVTDVYDYATHLPGKPKRHLGLFIDTGNAELTGPGMAGRISIYDHRFLWLTEEEYETKGPELKKDIERRAVEVAKEKAEISLLKMQREASKLQARLEELGKIEVK